MIHIAILGFGREGKSVLKFLRKAYVYKDAKIVVCDRDPNIRIHPNDTNIKLQKGKSYLKNLKCFGLIFRSPGIPYQTPALFRARCDGVKFSSATILFFEHSPTQNIIGITGSKGKGTTATLLYKVMKAVGKDVYLAGNIGKPALEILPKLKKSSWVILELSSFQLQDLPYSPHLAIVLDMFPEHLDHHRTLREYYGSKANIVRFQKSSDLAFYAKDNAVAARTAEKGKGKKIPIDTKSFSLFTPSELRMPGTHNFKNAVAAARVAQALGIPEHIIRRVVTQSRGNEHRLELVRRIGKVSFWNDSASTNPHTTIAAIQAFPDAQKILIMGGQDKGLDYRSVASALKHSHTKLVVLFGENKEKIHRAINKAGVPIKGVRNIKSAAGTAFRESLSVDRKSNVAVLFSPGAASFDMFKNYADRGARFKELVKELKVR